MVDIFIQIVPKLVAAFLIMMIYIHLSGKGSLAPISTIDQVGNVVLGAIIGGTIYNPEVGSPSRVYGRRCCCWSGISATGTGK